jgi:hypothetical protein
MVCEDSNVYPFDVCVVKKLNGDSTDIVETKDLNGMVCDKQYHSYCIFHTN